MVQGINFNNAVNNLIDETQDEFEELQEEGYVDYVQNEFEETPAGQFVETFDDLPNTIDQISDSTISEIQRFLDQNSDGSVSKNDVIQLLENAYATGAPASPINFLTDGEFWGQFEPDDPLGLGFKNTLFISIIIILIVAVIILYLS